MIQSSANRLRRRAATTVETAAVISVVLLFLFGILEYARLVYFFHVADNAAREGARYASVHTGDGTTTAQVQAVVTGAMYNQQASLNSGTFAVNIYNADPNTGSPIAGTAWTDAPFGGGIGVEVTGTYKFVLPTFLKFSGPTIGIKVRSIMNSEAN
ncbi:MAG TPA: TadE/TadG family type IV pilus assembly protein [Gemmataceae bacterium]|nr:TadE/TadG family type IV pilus assembly protein [Gemmataceae bacterium]